MVLAALYMAITGFLRLRFAFVALVELSWGAVDLRYRFDEVTRWYAGLPVYGAITNADYPPAAYATLLPLLGWLPLEASRVLWAIVVTLFLVALAYLVARESSARTIAERSFVVLLVFPMYGAQMTVWSGQLGIFVLVLLLAALLPLARPGASAWRDAASAVLIALALVKPSITAPFLWVVLFVPGRLRPAVITAVVYTTLTFVAAIPREERILTLMRDWLTGRSAQMPAINGHANLHKWLELLGLDAWMLPASLLAFLALGAWVYRHRRTELWTVLAVTALVARLWFHHWAYDDVLLILPMVALYRIVRRGATTDGRDVVGALSFAMLWAIGLAPVRAFSFDVTPPEWVHWTVEIVQSGVWLATLAFLLYVAERLRAELSLGGDAGQKTGTPSPSVEGGHVGRPATLTPAT